MDRLCFWCCDPPMIMFANLFPSRSANKVSVQKENSSHNFVSTIFSSANALNHTTRSNNSSIIIRTIYRNCVKNHTRWIRLKRWWIKHLHRLIYLSHKTLHFSLNHVKVSFSFFQRRNVIYIHTTEHREYSKADKDIFCLSLIREKTDIDNPPIVIFMRHSDDQDSLKQFLK